MDKHWTHTWKVVKKCQTICDGVIVIIFSLLNIRQVGCHIPKWALWTYWLLSLTLTRAKRKLYVQYRMLNCIQVLSILKQLFIIQQHSLYPGDIQYAWCLSPIPSPVRLFYCMIIVLYIILPLILPYIPLIHSHLSPSFLLYAFRINAGAFETFEWWRAACGLIISKIT